MSLTKPLMPSKSRPRWKSMPIPKRLYSSLVVSLPFAKFDAPFSRTLVSLSQDRFFRIVFEAVLGHILDVDVIMPLCWLAV